MSPAPSAPPSPSRLRRRATTLVLVALEAQGELGEGIVEVECRVNAEAYTDTVDAPERFAVAIQER